jgi:S1-C subfamily serine protease
MIKKASGNGPSDHATFYAKKIPVIFCWTYYHEDYHTPRDTADKINVPGMRKIVDFAGELIAQLSTNASRPEFVEVKVKSPLDAGAARSRGSVPRLGIRPSYDDDEDKGMLLDDVFDDGPAGRAGLKLGDRIVEVAGKPVKNVSSYMAEMAGRKQAGTLDIVVLRGGKRIPVKIKLD